MRSGASRRRAAEPIRPRTLAAARHLIDRVIREVPAPLVEASLFGSRARGDARPDSDVDILLVFRRLPPDREPHASIAEEIADQVASATGVPVTVWSVSLQDFECGARTPMLVDALADAIPLWCPGRPLPPVPFTPADAVRCTGALLARVAEGEVELARHLAIGAAADAALRVRDDLVRMCTALELLRGRTRARRGELPLRVLHEDGGALPPSARRALRWAAGSYGRDGRDSEAPVPPPPDAAASCAAVGQLRRLVRRRRAALAARLRHPPTAARRPSRRHPNCTRSAFAGPHTRPFARGTR